MGLSQSGGVKTLVRIHPFPPWFAPSIVSRPAWGVAPVLSSQPPTLTRKPPSVLSPFARCRYYRRRGDVYRLLRGHCSSVIAPTDSCAKPFWLSLPSIFHLSPRVSAGCYQPLLPAGSSRLYLCKSFPRCLVPYPDGPIECSYLFLPRCQRPSPRHYGSASRFYPRMRLSRGVSFRGCRHFFMFKPLSLLVSQIAPTAASFPTGQPRPFTSGHIVLCYLRTLRICYPSDTGN